MKKNKSACVYWVFLITLTALLCFAIGYTLAAIRTTQHFAYYDWDPDVKKIQIRIKDLQQQDAEITRRAKKALDALGISFHDIAEGEK